MTLVVQLSAALRSCLFQHTEHAASFILFPKQPFKHVGL